MAVSDTVFDGCKATTTGGAVDTVGGIIDFDRCEFENCEVAYTPEEQCLTLTMLGSLGSGWHGARMLVIQRDNQDRIGEVCPSTCYGQTCQEWDDEFGKFPDYCDYYGRDITELTADGSWGCDCWGCPCTGYTGDDDDGDGDDGNGDDDDDDDGDDGGGDDGGGSTCYLSTCYGNDCDSWVNAGYSCATLEAYGCDW
jgi:hypothetical protein